MRVLARGMRALRGRSGSARVWRECAGPTTCVYSMIGLEIGLDWIGLNWMDWIGLNGPVSRQARGEAWRARQAPKHARVGN